MIYDFSNLTGKQQELLTFQGWTVDSVKSGRIQPGKSTVRKLIARRLVTAHEIKLPGRFGVLTVVEYEVPIPVHIAWCKYCERLEQS